MSTEISIFNFDSNEVRTITDDHGEPWFVLADVLSAMGSKTHASDAKDSVIQVFGDGVVNDVPILDSLGRTQQAAIVSEAGATCLVSRGNTETSKKLNRFIHTEVLPQIRKTGKYAKPMSTADRLIEMAYAYKEHETRIMQLEDEQDNTKKQIAGLLGGEEYAPVKGYAKMHGHPGDLASMNAAGKAASKICRQRGIRIGKVNDEVWGQVNSYPRSVLEEIYR